MNKELNNSLNVKCLKCYTDNSPQNKYCNKCGKKIIVDNSEIQLDKVFDRSIKLILLIFFIEIVILFINHYQSDKVNIHPITWDVIWDTIFVVFTFIFTYFNWKNIRPLVSFGKISLKLILTVVIISIVWAYFVFYYVDFIYSLFNITNENEGFEVYGFSNKEYFFTYLIFTTAFIPGITEELIMRGVLYNLLKNVVNEKSVIYITAFLFAITHLNLLSATWIIFNGIFYGVLRYKTNNIMYGIIGHITHNLVMSFLIVYW